MCPLCRRPFVGTQLTVNGELRELVALARALGCAPVGEDAEGWQAVTSQARAQQLWPRCCCCPVATLLAGNLLVCGQDSILAGPACEWLIDCHMPALVRPESRQK